MEDYTGHIEELHWVAVDLDGVLAEGVWPDRGIGKPIDSGIYKLTELLLHDYKPVIHTSRPWSDYGDIETWLKRQEIPHYGIVCGKLLARAYIDDRAVNSSSEIWLP